MYKTNLSLGKMRGLSATSSPCGVFSILAFDHRGSLVKMISAGSPHSAAYEEVVSVKKLVVETLSPHSSAILLDPEYSAAQSIINGLLPGNKGLIVALDETGYTGPSYARRSNILADWSVAKIKRMGADAVKLLIYYHPNAGDATSKQERLVRKVVAECSAYDIALFLEPIIYSIDPHVEKKSVQFVKERPRIIVETAHRLSRLEPDVLKLEFPLDVKFQLDENEWSAACRAVSDAAICPWSLLSAGVDFDTFACQVEIACLSGASGFIGGRAIWKEYLSFPAAEKVGWLKNVAASRLVKLSRIAGEYAKPWREFLPDQKQFVSPGWYKDYAE